MCAPLKLDGLHLISPRPPADDANFERDEIHALIRASVCESPEAWSGDAIPVNEGSRKVGVFL